MKCSSHKIRKKEILNALLSTLLFVDNGFFFPLKLILCGFNYVKKMLAIVWDA